MTHVLPLTPTGTEPETSAPPPERVLHGAPVHTAWRVEDLDCFWQFTPGTGRVSHGPGACCRVPEGHSVVTGDGRAALRLRRDRGTPGEGALSACRRRVGVR